MRVRAYPEYQECEGDWVKNIPASWRIKRGKFLFEIKKRIVGEEGHDVLSITQKGIKIKDTESGDGQLSMDYSKYQIVDPGDFAMNHMDLLTGYVDISKYQGVTSPDYRVFSCRENNENSRFYLYVFQMGYTNKIFFKYGQGASHLGRWRLPTEEFNNFWFPCPPDEDKETIGNYLDYETGNIDTLIKKQQQLIKLLKEKRKVVISHAVTKGLNPNISMRDSEVEWLGRIPTHWIVSALKYQLVSLDYRRIPLSSEERGKRPGSFPYYGASGIIDYIDDYIFDEATILVGEDGANIVNRRSPLAFTAKGKYWVNNHAHILRPPDNFAEFWAEAIEHIDVNPLVSGSAQPKLTAEALNNLKVTFPPSLEEREEIENYINNHKENFMMLIKKASNQIQLLKERRIALISAAVTGKIDVRNWQSPESSTNKINKEAAA